MKKFYVGVDIGGTAVKIGFFDKKKKMITKYKFDTVVNKKSKHSDSELMNCIMKSIDDFCDNNKYGITKKSIIGIGVTVPGPVVNKKVLKAVNLNWKKPYDVVKVVKKHYGSKVVVDVMNDAKAATLGEYVFALNKKYKNMCFMTLGTAIGAGIIVNGKILEGSTGIAGEIGHIRVDFSKDATFCQCGNHGCLETVVSATGVRNIYNKLYKYKAVDGTKIIVDMAKRGDRDAYNALSISMDYLANLIVILMHTVSPDVVELGGGLSKAGKILIDILNKKLKERVFMTKKLPKVIISKLKNDAGMYGAVANL